MRWSFTIVFQYWIYRMLLFIVFFRTEEPFIFVVWTRPLTISGIRLRTYVNDSIKASPIRKLTILAGKHRPLMPKGAICSPDEYYRLQPSVIDYIIAFDKIELQYLQLEFEYSGDWILVRQLEFIRPGRFASNLRKLFFICWGDRFIGAVISFSRSFVKLSFILC